MSDLKCRHCGIEKSYADANITDIRGDKCSKNTETKSVNGWKYTKELEHEWIEK